VNVTYAIVGSAAAVALPVLAVSQWRSRRKKRMADAVPDVVDLLVLCTEGGVGLDAALRHVTEAVRDLSLELASELAIANAELQAGGPRDLALRALAKRTAVPEVRDVAELLIEVDALGTSVGEALRKHSEDSRRRRRERARKKASTLPMKMSAVLAGFFLLPLLVVIAAPIGIQAYQQLFPESATVADSTPAAKTSSRAAEPAPKAADPVAPAASGPAPKPSSTKARRRGAH